MMTIYKSERTVKVTKTDAVGIDVTEWANGEEITTLSVSDPTGFSSVGATNIAAAILTVLITGLGEGVATLHFEYATATRQDCVELQVDIVADC